MKAHSANLLNSLTLIILGLWGFSEHLDQPTAFIPVAFGVALIIATKGIKENNKIISHIAVLFTIIIFAALVGMRLPKLINEGGIDLYRVVVMSATSFIAIIFFIKSFIDARKK